MVCSMVDEKRMETQRLNLRHRHFTLANVFLQGLGALEHRRMERLESTLALCDVIDYVDVYMRLDHCDSCAVCRWESLGCADVEFKQERAVEYIPVGSGRVLGWALEMSK